MDERPNPTVVGGADFSPYVSGGPLPVEKGNPKHCAERDGSQLWGMSLRTLAACSMIVPPVGVICYIAVIGQDPTNLLFLIGTGGGYLFGKAAGRNEGKDGK